MRLLLDEDSGSHSLLTALRKGCHDVERVVVIRALGSGTTDEAVFDYSITENRILITKNGSDFIALAEPGRDHPGVLILHYAREGSKLDVSTIVRAIANIERTYESMNP